MGAMAKGIMLALILATAWPAAAWASSKQKAAGATEADAPPAMDKAHFQNYLQHRVEAINRQHAGRVAFIEKDAADSRVFWEKIRDEREKFQLRLTRQSMDLFDSLRSLDPKSYAATIANFEKLQTDFMRSFEQEQKDRIQAFFAGRAQRWADFAAAQDNDRSRFMSDVQAGWQDDKAALLAATKTSDGAQLNGGAKSSGSGRPREDR